MPPFTSSSGALIWRGDGETLQVEAWGRDSLRVRGTRSGPIPEGDGALLAPAPTSPVITIDGDEAAISNGAITARLSSRTAWDDAAGYIECSCRVMFEDASGTPLLSELPRGGSLKLAARRYRPSRDGGFSLAQSFVPQPGERIYGMGQYQQAQLNLKGTTLELAHRNTQASVPFAISSAGYGFLWNNPAVGEATFGLNRTVWRAESTDRLDYWITAAPTPADISRAYADATGHAPTMPEHGLGLWQSKLRYHTQDELLAVAHEHVRRGIPLDVIVADFFHWPHQGDFRFDEEFWPDPAAMVAELDELGIKLMVSVWPQVALTSENYADMKQRGLLVKTASGLDVQMGFEEPTVFFDATNPEARAFVWDRCKANYHDLGVRLFWLDEAEPEFGEYDFDHFTYHAGPSARVTNRYPLDYARGFYEGQRAAGQEDIVNLTRCAWAGSQRYGVLAWSGDVASTFESLAHQIVAGLHMGAAGIPWFTTDIGGFRGARTDDPEFAELLIRWFQFGAFSPVLRMHGDRGPATPVIGADGAPRCWTGAPNELWSYGERALEILLDHVRMRERLRPYLRQAMAETHLSGAPVMRALWWQFPSDPGGYDISDQYLLGPDLLVAPVIERGAEQRRVYLPDGASWTDLHTGEQFSGGQWVAADAPLATIPLYGRDGALAGLFG